MRIKDERISYVISIVLSFILLYYLPRLPTIGISEKDSLFTSIWLFFALLVLSSHLKVIFYREQSFSFYKKKKFAEQREGANKSYEDEQRNKHVTKLL